jgi:hypothetical protein
MQAIDVLRDKDELGYTPFDLDDCAMARIGFDAPRGAGAHAIPPPRVAGMRAIAARVRVPREVLLLPHCVCAGAEGGEAALGGHACAREDNDGTGVSQNRRGVLD